MDEKRESFKKAFEEVFYEGRIGMRRCCGRNACQKLIDMANRMDPNKPEGYYGDSRGTGMINEMQARHLKELLKICWLNKGGRLILDVPLILKFSVSLIDIDIF